MTRFAALPPWAARLVLLAVVAVGVFGMLATAGPLQPVKTATQPVQRDAELYRAVAKRISIQQSYYNAVAVEHRARGYPLKPFVTVRPPLLATATAFAGGIATVERVFLLVVLITAIVMALTLRAAVSAPAVRFAAMALCSVALVAIAVPELAIWHEAWAATLIALALAVRRPHRWGLSVGLGLTAAVLRELALPFLAVMAFCAASERHWREAIAWVAAIGGALLALGIHARHVAGIVRADDLVSPGWEGGGGWPFVVAMLGQSTVFAVLPATLVALAVPLALLGWVGWDTPMGRRAALWSLGMITAFMFVGRVDNFYWGMMLATTLPIGLAFAPRALFDLMRSAARQRHFRA